MNYKVLIVDDCETICKVISKMLKDYEVDTSNTTMDALLTLEDHKIAFVDFNLGEKTGDRLTRTMKLVRKVYVIGMSGGEYNGNAFDDFIKKPITVDKVKKAMYQAEIAVKLGRG